MFSDSQKRSPTAMEFSGSPDNGPSVAKPGQNIGRYALGEVADTGTERFPSLYHQRGRNKRSNRWFPIWETPQSLGGFTLGKRFFSETTENLNAGPYKDLSQTPDPSYYFQIDFWRGDGKSWPGPDGSIATSPITNHNYNKKTLTKCRY